MTQTQRLFVVNGAITVRLVPELAIEIGLQESLVLLQVDYLLFARGILMNDGKKWVKCSVRAMQSTFFPFWSVSTLGRTMKGLVERGYLLAHTIDDGSAPPPEGIEDTTLWYTYGPNCENLQAAKLTFVDAPVKSGGSKPSKPKEDKSPTTYDAAVAIAEVCNMDLQMNKGRLLKEAKLLAKSPDDIRRLFGPGSVWYTTDFRGKQGSAPTPSQLRTEWNKLSSISTRRPQQTVRVRTEDGALNI